MVPTSQSYMICGVQRSGSWLLADSLANSGIAGKPSDYFDVAESERRMGDWEIASFSEYLDAVVANSTTTNGVFGTKMMWNDFERFRSNLRTASAGGSWTDSELLDRTFPGLRYVWLRREDKVRQAVSWWRASMTDEWALTDSETASGLVPEFDADAIGALVQFALACEQGWREWFQTHNIAPVEVTYEQLIEDRLVTTNVVLEHLGLPHLDVDGLRPPRYRKQSDDLTDEYVRRFRALKCH